MSTRKILWRSWVVLAAFAYGGSSLAHTYSHSYEPNNPAPYNYFDSREWSEAKGTCEASAAANKQSGSVGVYAAGLVGVAAAEASHYISFYLPVRSSVKATPEITYIGGSAEFGVAVANTYWLWKLDDDDVHKCDIEEEGILDWLGVTGDILGLIGEFEDVAGKSLGEAIGYLGVIADVIELGTALYQLYTAGDAHFVMPTASFTADKGWHTLKVGLRAEGSGGFIGSGFGVMAGQISKITLEITNDYDGPPDLTVTDIAVKDGRLQRDQLVCFDLSISNVGKGPAEHDKYSFYVREPNESVPIVVEDNCGDYLNFKPHTTEHMNPLFTFNKKGVHHIIVDANPMNDIDEADHSNNSMEKEFYVMGLPPDVPTAPSVPVEQPLIRNHTYSFSTSSTDPDGETVYYRFYIRRQGQSGWHIPAWDPNSYGWHTGGSISYVPSGSMSEPGTYYIRSEATDGEWRSGYSKENFFEVALNEPPTPPQIAGLSTGYTDVTLSFTLTSTDLEGDDMEFRVDWGDGSGPTEWSWPGEGRNSISLTHEFGRAGSHTIQAQARDALGAESDWSSRTITVNEHVLPPGSIKVTANQSDAGFSVYEFATQQQYDGSGTFWSMSGNSGWYKATFDAVAGYNKPPASTKYLNPGQTISFSGNYTHKLGDIEVRSNLPSASFAVKGSGTAKGQNYTGSGGLWSKSDVYVGDYTAIFFPLSGYCRPTESGQTKALGENSTVYFHGTYLRRPVALLDCTVPQPVALEGEGTVKFDGSGSYCQDQGVYLVKYEFDFDDGNAYTETLQDAPDGTFDGLTTHRFNDNETYTVKLTVYDNHDHSSSETVAVDVKARPVADITIDPPMVIAGENVHFHGSGNDDDNDTIISYQWESSIDGPLTGSASFSRTDLSLGLHRITLEVEDSDHVWSAEAYYYLEVTSPRKWPMFKRDKSRLSMQPPYRNRRYGRLDYDRAWSYFRTGAVTGSPVAVNTDADWTNGLEIVFAAGDGNLCMVNNSGDTLLWSKNIGLSVSTPAVDHLTEGGPLCVVVGSANGVYAFKASDGSDVWANPFSATTGGAFDSSPVIADIDFNPGNGNEVIITCADGCVYAIDGSGNSRWSYPAVPPSTPPSSPAPFIVGSAAVAEIEPTLYGLETIIGGRDGYLRVLDPNGSLITTWPSGSAVGPIETTPAVGELAPPVPVSESVPPAPGPEIVFGSDDGHLYCLTYKNKTLTLLWTYPGTGPALQPVKSSPAVGVVGEQRKAQVAFGCDGGTLYILKGADGTVVGSFSCGSGVKIRSTPAITNLDTVNFINPTMGDQPEVVFGADNGNIYAVSFALGGANLPWSPLGLASGMPIMSSPAIADINHDPEMEILICADDGGLHMFKPFADANLAPVPDFSADQVGGDPPLAVCFTDDSSGQPYAWAWDFGDGETSHIKDPEHVYAAPGIYTVGLTATNEHGSRPITKADYITVNPVPVAEFAHSPVSGTVPLTVDFSDHSLYGPSSWSWTFGDTGTSSEQSPTHTYTAPGLYTVALSVSNGYGSDTATKNNCVLVMAAMPQADFTMDVISGRAPLQVNFTDASTGDPTAWKWNFGDGDMSCQQNPSHVYTKAGMHLVSLTVSNSAGSDTKTASAPIAVQPRADSVLIPAVPDHSQPPTQTLGSTATLNFCAPMAAANASEYWDRVVKSSNAVGVDAAWTGRTAAEYIGYFMDTNNSGSVERGNGTDNHAGTYANDVGPGLSEFARWDACHAYDAPPAAPPQPAPQKMGYTWQIQTDYSIGWARYKAEIDGRRPSVVVFSYWNPQSAGINFADSETGEEISVMDWGGQITNSQQADPQNPEEQWNLEHGEGAVGHAVTGMGYIENWDPDGAGPLPADNYAIVHDNWATTAGNLAVPWRNWVATVCVKVEPRTDLNHDGLINFEDFAPVAACWTSQMGQQDYTRSNDLDGDNSIGPLDAALLAEDWLLSTRPIPVGHWSFDDGQGTIALDTGLGGNHGMLAGDVTWAAGKAGSSSLDFDGDGDYVKTQDIARRLDFAPGSFSVSAWISAREVTGRWRAILEYGRYGQNWFGIWLNAEGRFHFRVGGTTKNSNRILNTGEWYLISATYDSVAELMSLYINGQFDDSSTHLSGFGSPVAGKLTIGAYGLEDGEYFNGFIDEILIYDAKLELKDIQDLFSPY